LFEAAPQLQHGQSIVLVPMSRGWYPSMIVLMSELNFV
jgi:hypothetical protein